MKATEYFKYKVQSGEITSDEALAQVLDILESNTKFIDSLMTKYTEYKNISIKNKEQFKNHPKYEWHDCLFISSLLFLWDLEDIKCRSGMSDE